MSLLVEIIMRVEELKWQREREDAVLHIRNVSFVASWYLSLPSAI